MVNGVASRNIDHATVAGFGDEWSAFDQTRLSDAEWRLLFHRYFALFPWEALPPDAEGFDLGCGSGRWAAGVAPRVGRLHCIDPSAAALDVARRRLADCGSVRLHQAAADNIPLPDESQDFGYSLGVLHHVPDTSAALAACIAKLKPGAPFLLYLYYALDDRPWWFQALWRTSDVTRRAICRLPFALRRMLTTGIAVAVYWPLARTAMAGRRANLDVRGWPLASYREASFYTMRTDALDRFGTRLEQRFSRAEIAAMMAAAGLEDVRFSDSLPFWVAVGVKRSIRA